jgi:beta-barrel assembly-enhancing protease
MQERQAANLAVLVLNRITDRDFSNRLTQVGEFVLFQSFSREDEHDADIVGTELMARAGYNPRGMVQMLDKLNNMESRGIIIPFLRSHPSSGSRARLVEEYISRNNLEKPTQVMDTRQFHQIIR